MSPPASAVAAAACAGCVTYLGLDFRPASAIIGILAAFLVRVPLLNSGTKIVPEASFILLGMLGAFVTIVDQRLGPGLSFMAGVCFGAVAGTLRELGKRLFTAALKDRFQAAMRLLLGMEATSTPLAPDPAPRSDPAHAEPVAQLWTGTPPPVTAEQAEQLRRLHQETKP
jgi:hypothetical protein